MWTTALGQRLSDALPEAGFVHPKALDSNVSGVGERPSQRAATDFFPKALGRFLGKEKMTSREGAIGPAPRGKSRPQGD